MKFKALFKAVEFAANVIIVGSAAKSIYNKFTSSDEEDDDNEDEDDLDDETDENDED